MTIYGSMNNNSTPRSDLSLLLWLAYVFFVVYGSLVPLQYKPLPLNEAWAAFQNIPFLQLGVESRADWVANGVLYVPVAFLTTHLLVQSVRKIPRIFLFVLAAAFSIALAVAVEFTQLYFPPRTVSLNDILAECIGSVVGLALSIRYASWFEALLKSLFNDPRRLKLLALDGYIFAYFAFAMFPYDLLLSWPELSAKQDSGNWGWHLAGGSSSISLSSFQLVVEVVLTIPFGFLLARRAGLGRVNYMQAAVIGLLLGGFIEVAQFFIASGVSQGLSVLAKAIGVCSGVALSKHGAHWTLNHIAITLRRYTPALAVAYLMALLGINGWFTLRWQGLHAATAQLAEVNFMPFYYHYFTTEAIALFSLGVVSLSYMPVGLLVWARARSPAFAAAVSSFGAVCIESGKLFIQGVHPDPTNILLAGTASWFMVRLMRQLSVRTPLPVESSAGVQATKPAAQAIKTPWLGLVTCFVAAGIWVITFPAFPALVGLLLIACAATVWHRPVWVFAVIAAALPVLDFAPWSGRYFLDEFDALLLISLAVAYARVPALPGGRSRADALFAMVASLVVLSFAISALVGLRPFALPEANAFNNDYSPYNALRIVKGALWAAVVFGLSRRFVARGFDARRSFCWGMVVGLGLTVAVIVWERVAFSELWNFTDGYRVTGPFSATHTGGAYVDCFLAAAVPFLIILTLEKRHWLVKSAGMLLILATTYALMVTFSRGGYLSFAVAVFIVLLVYAVNVKRVAKQWVRSAVIFAGLTGTMLIVAVPIFKSEFAQSRVADASADFGFRKAHWQDALNIRDPGWATTLFGMGLGRFPDTKYWRSALDPKPGTYRLQNEAGNTYLRLDSGESISVEQFVSLEPGEHYTLKLDVRPSRPNSRITVPICEKWLLTSADCVSPTFELGKEFGNWRSVEARFNAEGLSAGPWYRTRPIKLALTYAVPQSTIDIDNVRLETERNTNLLQNGDFSQGLDHWFFATAGALHAHWRVHSLYYGVLFEQGWFGLFALGAFFSLAICRAAPKAWQGDVGSGASLAALGGFLAGGLFDTQIDSPRFLLLLLLLAGACYYPFARWADVASKPSRTAFK